MPHQKCIQTHKKVMLCMMCREDICYDTKCPNGVYADFGNNLFECNKCHDNFLMKVAERKADQLALSQNYYACFKKFPFIGNCLFNFLVNNL